MTLTYSLFSSIDNFTKMFIILLKAICNVKVSFMDRKKIFSRNINIAEQF